MELQQELSHRHLADLAPAPQAAIEGLQFRVEPYGCQGGHVQGPAHLLAASPDGAAAVMLAAVAGPRRQAGQGGHALGVPLAQFRQVGQQVAAVSAPDADALVQGGDELRVIHQGLHGLVQPRDLLAGQATCRSMDFLLAPPSPFSNRLRSATRCSTNCCLRPTTSRLLLGGPAPVPLHLEHLPVEHQHLRMTGRSWPLAPTPRKTPHPARARIPWPSALEPPPARSPPWPRTPPAPPPPYEATPPTPGCPQPRS